jgi:hypothetical protein
MPTHEELPEFRQAFDKLDAGEQELFMDALEKFIGAIKRRDDEFSGKRIEFPKALRVKGVKGHAGIWKMTWEMGNGRATFEYGPPRKHDVTHVIWRRIGGHVIFDKP